MTSPALRWRLASRQVCARRVPLMWSPAPLSEDRERPVAELMVRPACVMASQCQGTTLVSSFCVDRGKRAVPLMPFTVTVLVPVNQMVVSYSSIDQLFVDLTAPPVRSRLRSRPGR